VVAASTIIEVVEAITKNVDKDVAKKLVADLKKVRGSKSYEEAVHMIGIQLALKYEYLNKQARRDD